MPAGVAVPFELRSHAGGAIPAKLNSTMAVTALSFTVQPGQGASYPDGTSGPFFVSLDYGATGMEHVRVVSRSGDTFNLNSLADRGLMGTTALQHEQGAAVSHGPSATEADEAGAAAHNTLGQITAKGDILYADSATTMAAFAKGSAGQSPVYQADSSVAAGNPIPAAHIHNITDVTGAAPGILATNQSAAWTGTGFLTGASASPAAVDLTHATLTFTVPASGKVKLTYSALQLFGSDGWHHSIWWQNHSGGATVGAVYRTGANDSLPQPGGLSYKRVNVAQVVTGLTASASLTLDLWHQMNGGTQGITIYDCYVEAVGL